MKFLGTSMIVVGVLLSLTFVFIIPGLAFIGIGALLRIAAAMGAKNNAKAAAGE